MATEAPPSPRPERACSQKGMGAPSVAPPEAASPAPPPPPLAAAGCCWEKLAAEVRIPRMPKAGRDWAAASARGNLPGPRAQCEGRKRPLGGSAEGATPPVVCGTAGGRGRKVAAMCTGRPVRVEGCRMPFRARAPARGGGAATMRAPLPPLAAADGRVEVEEGAAAVRWWCWEREASRIPSACAASARYAGGRGVALVLPLPAASLSPLLLLPLPLPLPPP